MPPTRERQRRRSGRRRSRGRVRRPSIGVATGALAIAVVVSPQLFGGAFAWSVAVIAGLCGVAGFAAAWAARKDSRPVPSGPVVAAAALGVLWTGLQVAPLPRALTSLLQPSAVELADDAARLLGDDSPGWIPLSLSPSGTRRALVEGLALVTCFLAASLVAGLGHRRRVFQIVGVSVVAMAVSGLAHLAADADTVFGVYEPVYTSSPLLAPLLNNNHLSGFFGMGVPVLMGLGLDSHEKPRRVAWLGGAVVVVVCTLITASRGGAASLVVGLLALGALVWLRRSRRGGSKTRSPLLLIGGTGLIAVGLGLYLASERLFRQFERADFSKLELAGRGLALSLDHPFVGVGRGAFSAAFVSEHGSHLRFTHPENLVAQWVSEWGFVVAALLLACLAIGWVRAVRTARRFARLGAAAGLLAIAMHDLVDFSLEMVGVGVVAAALAGGLMAPSRSGPSPARDDREKTERFSRREVTWAATIATVAALVVIGWRLPSESIPALRTRLEHQMLQGDRAGFDATLREAIRLHPAEPAFVLLGGAEATRHREASALRWLNRAMELAPRWPAPHHEAARYLTSTGRPGQAFIEIRAAAERGQAREHELACRLLRGQPEQTDAFMRAAGADATGLRLMNRVSECLPLEAVASVELDRLLLEHDRLDAALRSARRAMTNDDHERALELLDRASDEPNQAVAMLRARVLLRAGRPADAVAALDEAELWGSAHEDVLRLRARAQAAAADVDSMRETMMHLRGRAAGSADGLARAWIYHGSLERELGNEGRAMQAYERAHRLDPDSAALGRLAALARDMGDYGRSYHAYSELCRRDGEDSRACRAREQVRSRMVEGPRQLEQLQGAP